MQALALNDPPPQIFQCLPMFQICFLHVYANSAELCDVGHTNFDGKFPFTKSPTSHMVAMVVQSILMLHHKTIKSL